MNGTGRRTIAANRVGLICQSCGQLLGEILNYGAPTGVSIQLPCPCGGSSQTVELGDLYEAESTGVLREEPLHLEVEEAIHRFRRQAGGPG